MLGAQTRSCGYALGMKPVAGPESIQLPAAHCQPEGHPSGSLINPICIDPAHQGCCDGFSFPISSVLLASGSPIPFHICRVPDVFGAYLNPGSLQNT